jgi:diguanylate cyclase (GGDEF)-like protein
MRIGGVPGTIRRLALPFAIVLAMMATMLVGLTYYFAGSMDQTHLGSQKAAIDNAISQRLTRMLNEQMSVAWWDDAVVHSASERPDKAWLDQSVGRFLQSSYDHDAVIILDEQNRPVYSFADGATITDSQIATTLEATQTLVDQVRGGPDVSKRISEKSVLLGSSVNANFAEEKVGRSAAALLKTGNGAQLVSVMTIVPDKTVALVSPTPRLLMSKIDVDNALLLDIGKSVMISDLSFKRVSDTRIGQQQLIGDTGQSLGTLGWSANLPGTSLIGRVLPIVVAALAATYGIIGALTFFLFRSTIRLADREAEAQRLANHDMVTGLPNRRSLEAEIARRFGSDTANGRLTCAILGLDRLKDINDTLGYHAGDTLIRAVSERLAAKMLPSDFLACLGGDEFTVLRNCTGLHDTEDLSSLISQTFDEPFSVHGNQIEASASVGIAIALNHDAVDTLLQKADIALNEAKAKQRGSTVRFTLAMAEKIEVRRSLEIDLKHAIANRELKLQYQPIVAASTGKISSVEALVRWHSVKHGQVPPDKFVPIAEDCGLMPDLGRLVIDQAVEDSKRWPQLTTAINISPAQLRSASIVNDIVGAAKRHSVAPEQIVLEVTESILLSNDERTLHLLSMIKEHGFGLALDDFGSGYSSLAYVRDFPFDKLKIDRSFVRGQEAKKRSIDIIKAIVNFGRILGREIIAEGIETEQEMQTMQAAGVTHLQGYLFSKPLSASHIEALVAASGRLSATRSPSDAERPSKVSRLKPRKTSRAA